MVWLQKLANDTLLVLRFFSILPLPERIDFKGAGDESQSNGAGLEDAPKLNQAIAAFPVAGLIIAVPSALIWYFASHFLSPMLAAGLAVMLATVLTGALHEDGLADCADGLGGGSSREQVFKIMRDSTIGTYGASALFFSFTLRILALASLSPWSGAMALLMAHTTARASMIIAILTAKYVRPSGLGNVVGDGVNSQQFANAAGVYVLTCIAIALAAGQLFSLVAAAAGLLSAWALLRWLVVRLGGYTGDGLGAMEQISEIVVLVVLAGLWA